MDLLNETTLMWNDSFYRTSDKFRVSVQKNNVWVIFIVAVSLTPVLGTRNEELALQQAYITYNTVRFEKRRWKVVTAF